MNDNVSPPWVVSVSVEPVVPEDGTDTEETAENAHAIFRRTNAVSKSDVIRFDERSAPVNNGYVETMTLVIRNVNSARYITTSIRVKPFLLCVVFRVI